MQIFRLQRYVGARYKCTVCENIDFCAACVASFHNRHDARHAMIKCLLPTSFRTIRDIDDIAKKGLLQQSGQSRAELDDLTHVIYAETQQEYLPKSPPASADASESSVARPAANDEEPTMFVISEVAVSRARATITGYSCIWRCRQPRRPLQCTTSTKQETSASTSSQSALVQSTSVMKEVSCTIRTLLYLYRRNHGPGSNSTRTLREMISPGWLARDICQHD